MRKIAQTGTRAPRIQTAQKEARMAVRMAKKKAQTGTKYTSNKSDQKEIEERQKYLDRILNTNRPDTLTARSRYVPGLTERQERANIINERVRRAQENAPKQKSGGKSVKRVKKAQLGNKLPGAKPYGEAMRDSTLKKALEKKYAKPKAKYGAAKKASSKRYK